MINAEFYKEELSELAKKNKRCGITQKGELVDCYEINCIDCQWDIEGTDCECERIKWFLAEHKEYPKLTRFQYEFLTKLVNRFDWIARNEIGEIIVYSGDTKPYKVKNWGYWHYDDDDINYLLDCLDDFDFVKWSDSEPWNIQELLENCEVEK